MFQSKVVLITLSILAVSVSLAQSPGTKPKLVRGPARAQLGTVAQLEVPTGCFFMDGKDYQALLKADREPASGEEVGYLSSTNGDWAVVFRFSDVGYVKDSEKEHLAADADKILAQIKRGTAEANKERAAAGHPTIDVVGWEMPPKYDATTHNLEWAIRGSVEGRDILNYDTRLLGRKGVMKVKLIVKPAQLSETLPTFRNLLAGYSYQTGQTYAEFRPGDKIAKYGLGALVVGGAAVGAAKLGLFALLAVFLKKGWKLLVVAFAAAATFIKKLFAKLTGRQSGPSLNQ